MSNYATNSVFALLGPEAFTVRQEVSHNLAADLRQIADYPSLGTYGRYLRAMRCPCLTVVTGGGSVCKSDRS